MEHFRFFDPARITRGWRQSLPHLEQREICYFVTFMTRDAIPKAAREKWAQRRDVWLIQHGLPPGLDRTEIMERLPPAELIRFQRMLSSTYQRTMDKGSGECPLRRADLRAIVEQAMMYHADHTCLMGDFVIMPNHVHVLMQPRAEQTLKEILGSIRKYSAREINKILQRKGPFWAKEPFDHMVRSARHFRRYQQYIRANPARAKHASGMYTLSP